MPLNLRLTCDSVALKGICNEDLYVFKGDEVFVRQPVVDNLVRFTACAFAPLEDNHEVAGFVSVVAALDLDIISVNALHLFPISSQKIDLLLCHGEKHLILIVHSLSNIVSLARPRFYFLELKALSFIIEPPLLEIELDLADGGLLNRVLVAVEGRDGGRYLKSLILR